MTAADEAIIRWKRFAPLDRRLGRHINHDSRSRRFPARATDPRRLASIQHHINIGLMDQLDLGSCTGHGLVNVIASDPFWYVAKDAIGPGDPHVYAVGVYADATKLDPWTGEYLPDDTGSDGLSVAKVALARGLINGYEHAFSLEATLTALAQRVVMIGIGWRNSMYSPAADGRLTITGAMAGGHEFVLDELDVENRRAWMRNSWGPGWGLGGRAYLTWEDLGTLLADDGDCTILVPKSLPPPEPQPVPEKPTVPAAPAADRDLTAALTRYLHTSAGPSYMRRAAMAWLSTKE